MSAKPKLLIGTCSWTDPTLIESGWYPERIKDDADKRLRYYAEHFPIVENDAAFYALPSQKQAQLWAERTPDEFVMNFKAFATLTTHHTDPKRLPKDIREALPKEALAKKRLYPKDFPTDARALLPDDRLAVEFRNATWMSERNRAETLAFLGQHGLSYVAVDEPQGFPSSIPPVAAVTNKDLAIV